MQNKPNFRKSQMNLNLYNKRDYERKRNWKLSENKPNLSQFKPIKANFKPNQTQFKKSQNEYKLNYNKGLQKKRGFRGPNKQTQSCPP